MLQAKVWKLEGDLACLDVNVDGNFGETSHQVPLMDDLIQHVRPVRFFRYKTMDEIRHLSHIDLAIIVLKAPDHPVPHKRGQFEGRDKIILLQVFINRHRIESIAELIHKFFRLRALYHYDSPLFP